jgi:hypothetical protein
MVFASATEHIETETLQRGSCVSTIYTDTALDDMCLQIKIGGLCHLGKTNDIVSIPVTILDTGSFARFGLRHTG